jgi:hypothetical protein
MDRRRQPLHGAESEPDQKQRQTQRVISHSFAGECTKRGSRVKGLRVRSDERAQTARP